jgi:L,D-peptidoglycan transpeptidase YkuD (ErfK/YbiS/YcfS/YnhG family)
MSIRLSALLLPVLLAGCTHTPPETPSHSGASTRTEATAWQHAQQLVLVVTNDWNSTQAELRRFERGANGWQQIGGQTDVMLGRNGSAWGIGLNTQARTDGPIKHEGDGRAPAGVFNIGTAFGYAGTANTGLPYQAMTANDWCIDVPASDWYNTIIDRSVVKAPFLDQSSEPMRRDIHEQGDIRYREGFVIEHNVDGKARQGGSCIFAHLWQAPGETTAGCTAMAPESMEALLAWLDSTRKPVFVLLPKAQYHSLQQSWQLPEISQ